MGFHERLVVPVGVEHEGDVCWLAFGDFFEGNVVFGSEPVLFDIDVGEVALFDELIRCDP